MAEAARVAMVIVLDFDECTVTIVSTADGKPTEVRSKTGGFEGDGG